MDTQETGPLKNTGTADPVEIVYYTDPLCCWSWAMESQWRKLRYQFQQHLKWRYCMGGLLPSWNHFTDGVNSVSRPAQMGPIWMEASHISGMPISNRIWVNDPPASSYLACIAVKCAQLQSPELGDKYLRLLREAVMLHDKNIATQNVLVQLAEQLSEKSAHEFDMKLFQEDLVNDRGLEAFRQDLNEVQSRGIHRCPTFIFRRAAHTPLLLTGYRPYATLLEVMKQLLPEVELSQQPIDDEAYLTYWSTLTKRELEEAVAPHEVLKKLPV